MATTLQKIYSDLDLTFAMNPVTKDVSMSYDDTAVVRSVRNLLLTNFYERPFQPDLGSNVNGYLFEPTTAITASALETEIRNTIVNYEPRVNLINVNVLSLDDQNAFFVELQFFVGNNTLPSSINLLLERSR
jgi:phage baseplate assembly protein W